MKRGATEESPSPALRQRAALLHVAAAVPLATPLLWGTWQLTTDRFLRHHARQATLLSLGLLAVVALHLLLHLAISGVEALQRQVAEAGAGAPAAWTVSLLRVITYSNWGVMVVELLVLVVVSLAMIPAVRRGDCPEHFFLRRPGKSAA